MTLENLQKGCVSFVSYCLAISKSVEGKQGHSAWHYSQTGLHPYGHHTMCYTNTAVVNEHDTALALLGSEGSKIIKVIDDYRHEEFHARAIARSGLNPLIDLISPGLFAPRFADLEGGQAVLESWEAAATAAGGAGPGFLDGQLFLVWPTLPPPVLARICLVWSMDWNTALVRTEQLPEWPLAWSRKFEDGTMMDWGSQKSRLVMIQSLLAAKLPHRVHKSQAAEFLPKSDCEAFFDGIYQVLNLNPPSSLVACEVAKHLGLPQVATKYARATLAKQKNPVKCQYAYAILSSLTHQDQE